MRLRRWARSLCLLSALAAGNYVANAHAALPLGGATHLFAGPWDTCAQIRDKGSYCWGHGQNNARQLSFTEGAQEVQGTPTGGCLISSSGQLYCWGGNYTGTVGDGTTITRNTPVPVHGLSSVRSVAIGGYHTCAVTTAGDVYCWGSNGSGQLGDGTTADSYLPLRNSVSGAVAVGIGDGFSCAVLANGQVQCWGANWSGQLGNGQAPDNHLPVFVAGITNARSIAVGSSHACVLGTDAQVRCWGAGEYGQLGDGTGLSNAQPVLVGGLTNVTSLGVGWSSSCAVLADGSARCWGDNFSGQLGDGSGTDRHAPVAVRDLSGVAQLAVSLQHTCARLMDGSVRCWGFNDGGLGHGRFGSPGGTVLVEGLDGPTQAVIAGSESTCAVSNRGTTRCWGDDTGGIFGDGLGYRRSNIPSPATSLYATARQVAIGNDFACALYPESVVGCWGFNYDGQLGDGTGSHSASPVAVAGLTGVTQLSHIGYGATCGRTSEGKVWCWGRNDRAQLGDGSTQNRLQPVQVTGLGSVTLVETGPLTACAIVAGGAVMCWGANWAGQLGDGTRDDSPVPLAVPGLSGVTALALGYGVGCALKSDRTVTCWGEYEPGFRTLPLTDITALTPNCALKSSGTVWCWGTNWLGQLGFTDIDGSPEPVQVPGLANVRSLAWGYNHTCALIDGGALRCWGDNGVGQLGNPVQGNWVRPQVVVIDEQIPDAGGATLPEVGPSCADSTGISAPGTPEAAAADNSLILSFLSATPTSAVAGYVASCAPFGGGTAISVRGRSSPLTVEPLAAGKAYRCTVAALTTTCTGPLSTPVVAAPVKCCAGDF